jgi:hypothetical protein
MRDATLTVEVPFIISLLAAGLDITQLIRHSIEVDFSNSGGPLFRLQVGVPIPE